MIKIAAAVAVALWILTVVVYQWCKGQGDNFGAAFPLMGVGALAVVATVIVVVWAFIKGITP